IQVEFFDDAVSLGAVMTPPYHWTWSNAPPGIHSLTARATDNNGLAVTSPVVHVIAGYPPVITLMSPVNNSVLPAGSNVTLVADAFDDDGTIAGVQFLAGTNSLGIVTNVPYSIVWSNVPP